MESSFTRPGDNDVLSGVTIPASCKDADSSADIKTNGESAIVVRVSFSDAVMLPDMHGAVYMNEVVQTKSLLFIVGAGASKDFGETMPVGSDLASLIEQQLNDEFGAAPQIEGPIKSALMQSPSGMGPLDEQAAHRIRDALFAQDSIDDLLNEWRDDRQMIRMGKTAIANAILVAERTSTLGLTRTGDSNKVYQAITTLRECWLKFVLTALNPGTYRRQIGDIFSDVAFITFNYDRCIEQYLYWAFQKAAGVDADDAAQILARIPIVHVYGDLGRLPFQEGDTPVVGFGSESTIGPYIYERIKTYTEEDHDQRNLARVHALLRNAKRIIFLGLGYHQRNMDLLFAEGPPRLDAIIWGTSLNPNQTRLLAVQESLKHPSRQRGARLEPIACAPFLRSFWSTIHED